MEAVADIPGWKGERARRPELPYSEVSWLGHVSDIDLNSELLLTATRDDPEPDEIIAREAWR